MHHTHHYFISPDWSAVKTKATYPEDVDVSIGYHIFVLAADPSDYVSYSLKYTLPTIDKCVLFFTP